MNVHKNARLTPRGRVLMIERIQSGEPLTVAAAAAGVSRQTAWRWLRRYRAGDHALNDRSSAPHRCPRRIPSDRVTQVEALRRQRLSGPMIARLLGMATSSVGLVLRRIGLNRLTRLEPVVPAHRYEHAHPGDLIHIDTKSWAASSRPAIVSMATAPDAAEGWDGSTCMWPSMTAPGWLTPRCSPPKPA